MDNLKTDIAPIISKIAAGGTLTSEEQSAMDRWAARHSDNKDIYTNLLASAEEVFSPDFDKRYPDDFIFGRVMAIAARIQRRRKRRARMIGISAIASCLVLGTILFSPDEISESTGLAVLDGYILLTDTHGKVVNLENALPAELIDRGINLEKEEVDFSAAKPDSPMAETKILTISVPRKKDLNITLPDGSKVWLNSGSEISFPEYFDGATREVRMTGEAYFDIAADPSKPFIIKAGGLTTRVYGTKFLLSAYREDNYHRVSLVEGSLGVAVGGGEKSVILKPGEGLEYDRANDMTSLFKVNASETLAVPGGLFVFDKEPLALIATSLERWYGVSFIFDDPELADMKFYILIDKHEDIRSILDHLKATRRIDYRFDGSTVTFTRP